VREDTVIHHFAMAWSSFARIERRTPRPCSVSGGRRPCKRRERRLTGRALAVGVRKDLGGLRCLTLRYSLLLSVWVDPSAEHSFSIR